MSTEFTERLLDTDVLQRAASKLEERLAASPNDIATLNNLAEIYRKMGLIEQAAATFGDICRIDPRNRRAEYLKSLLAGEDLKPWPDDDPFQPPPFVRLPQFLPSDIHTQLLSIVPGLQSEFTPSTVVSGYNPEVSKSVVYYLSEDIYQMLKGMILESVPEICDRLRVRRFNPGYVSLEIKAYGEGDYFRPHSDKYTGGNRRLNFGCVFYFTPIRFSGGDFLLFDTDFPGQNYIPTRFTRFKPEDNCAIFYPSDSWHSVVPIKMTGGGFNDSRFAIIGHIEEE